MMHSHRILHNIYGWRRRLGYFKYYKRLKIKHCDIGYKTAEKQLHSSITKQKLGR